MTRGKVESGIANARAARAAPRTRARIAILHATPTTVTLLEADTVALRTVPVVAPNPACNLVVGEAVIVPSVA